MTHHFKKSEYACKCGCGTASIDPRLAYIMELIRCIIDEPVTITSACRCVDHNHKIGGKPHSYHLKGMACDFTCEHIGKVAILLLEWTGGLHFYAEDGFIHIDIGPWRRW